jgi:tagatose-1,6-bisphosphate aldolase non-catalytic subunit AgaZ/GatZ
MTIEVHDGADATRVAASTSSSVGEPGGKRVTVRFLDVANVKGAVVTLEVHDGAAAARVAASTSSSVGEPSGKRGKRVTIRIRVAASTSSSVSCPGGKRVTVRILDVANVKGAVMTLEVHDGADATRVSAWTSSSVNAVQCKRTWKIWNEL